MTDAAPDDSHDRFAWPQRLGGRLSSQCHEFPGLSLAGTRLGGCLRTVATGQGRAEFDGRAARGADASLVVMATAAQAGWVSHEGSFLPPSPRRTIGTLRVDRRSVVTPLGVKRQQSGEPRTLGRRATVPGQRTAAHRGRVALRRRGYRAGMPSMRCWAGWDPMVLPVWRWPAPTRLRCRPSPPALASVENAM
jgi:hypothetical protein